MRVVQMPIDEIVDMALMRYRLVSAAGTMDMAGFMTGTAMIRRAGVGVGLRHLDHMLVHVVAMRMVQMAIMQIVDMVAVPQCGVTAAGAMRVAMVGVVGLRTATHHRISLSWNHMGAGFEISRRHALRRCGHSGDGSEDADYITGQTLTIDGGLTIACGHKG